MQLTVVYQMRENHTTPLFEKREKSRYQMPGWSLGQLADDHSGNLCFTPALGRYYRSVSQI